MEALKREQPDEEELRKIFEELEFRTLLDRILKTEKKTAAPSAPVQSDLFGFFAGENTDEPKNSNLTRLEDLDFDYQLLDSEEKIDDFLQISLQRFFSLDTETTGTDQLLQNW